MQPFLNMLVNDYRDQLTKTKNKLFAVCDYLYLPCQRTLYICILEMELKLILSTYPLKQLVIMCRKHWKLFESKKHIIASLTNGT